MGLALRIRLGLLLGYDGLVCFFHTCYMGINILIQTPILSRLKLVATCGNMKQRISQTLGIRHYRKLRTQYKQFLIFFKKVYDNVFLNKISTYWRRIFNAPQEQSNRSKISHGFAGFRLSFIIFTQSTKTT